MTKKIRKTKTFAKTAPKSVEKRIRENAKKLMKNPFLFLPKCIEESDEKYIKKIKKRVEKVWKYRNNIDKLKRFSNKKGMEGALAGTLTIAHSDKASYLASAKILDKEIMYAVRGKADRDKLISLQHFDNPILRMIGFKDFSMKNKISLYSWNSNFLCTRNNAVPAKFKDFILNILDLKKEKNIAICPHLLADSVRDHKSQKKSYIRIEWKSADFIIGICEECAKKRNDNTIFRMSRYFIDPHFKKNIDIDVISSIPDIQQETDYIDEYLSGNLKDFDIIRKNMDNWKENLKTSNNLIFIANGVSYGDNIEKFIESLNPKEYERFGLRFVLSRIKKPVIAEDATANKILEMYWREYGKDLLKEIVKSDEIAEGFFSLKDTPSSILKDAFSYIEKYEKFSKLPRYKNLPVLAKFIDDLVKTYRIYGESRALTIVDKTIKNTKKRSIAYAFLLIVGKAKDRSWRYSEIEREYGEFLKDYLEKLIKAPPKDYDNTFRDILVASGSDEKLPKPSS